MWPPNSRGNFLKVNDAATHSEDVCDEADMVVVEESSEDETGTPTQTVHSLVDGAIKNTLSSAIEDGYKERGFIFYKVNPRSFSWHGEEVSPWWQEEDRIQSAVMLGAFLGFIHRFTRAPLGSKLPLPIVFHRDSDDRALATYAGILAPTICRMPGCRVCDQRLGGYQFRWISDHWLQAYLEKLEEVDGIRSSLPLWVRPAGRGRRRYAGEASLELISRACACSIPIQEDNQSTS